MKKNGTRFAVYFLTTCLLVMVLAPYADALSEFSRAVRDLADKLTSSVSGKIIDVRKDVAYINLGEKDSIFEGTVFEVIRQGQPLILDGKTYYEEVPVGKIQIIKVRENMALANIIAALSPIQKGDKVHQEDRIAPWRPADQAKNVRGIIGLTGIDLRSVHRRLENGGFVTGPFDERNLAKLSEAIKRFQKFANLNVTGELDDVTWSKLKILYDPKDPASKSAPRPYYATAKTPNVLKVNKIALMEFPHGNRFNDFTKNVYETLSVFFIQKGFQVVERSQLNRILAEQKISHSGLVDLATAQKLGKLLGSEVAVLGTVSDMGNDVIIRARMVDVEKGVSITASQVEIKKTPEILAMVTGHSRTGQGYPGSNPPILPEPSDHSVKGFPMVKKDKGFTFSLEKCELSGKALDIHFLITSNDRDRPLRLNKGNRNQPSRIFDDQGIEYWPNNIFLAGKKSNNYTVESLLISDVTTKANLHFENISSKAKKITRFDLGCWEGIGRSEFNVEFRNIPIAIIK